MNGFSTWLWSLILAGSTLAVLAGFAGGRSIGNAAPVIHARATPLPAPAVARIVRRALTGAHSLDESDDGRDDFDRAEDAVAARPGGWAPAHFDSRHDRPRVALVVVDAGVAGLSAQAFVDSPLPFALVVPAEGDDGGILQNAAHHHKSVLVDARSADAAAVTAARARGAGGALGDARAAAIAATLGGGVALDALLDDDAAFYQAARRANGPALTRDVIVDGRDGTPFLDAMFGSVLAIARRTGVAVAALHARPRTLAAAERFALQAQRDGVEIVPIEELVDKKVTGTKARPPHDCIGSECAPPSTTVL
ncbi:MAG: hypothetical protein NVSMB64_08480 [Candidatus Velthaea sp.]